MELLNTLKDLRRIISEDFYKRLLEGKIDDAKNTSSYIINLILSINKNLDKIVDTLESNVAGNISVTRKELQAEAIQFKNLIESELKNIDGKTFREDPAVWKELFEGVFCDITNRLLLIINNLIKQVEKQKNIKNLKIDVDSTEKYRNLKSRVKAYSDNLRSIRNMEDKIAKRLAIGDFSNPKITGRIKSGIWENFYHAHLPMPLGDHRIVYSWDGKTLKFQTIGTHKELGIS